ncbi:MAG TPA: hypothetical protein VL989_01260 [Candidatus Sulfotelmatobacter sp.]|nr:hypothetical protein [Candidatus Sulfotelmatobacter sp.]
MSKYTSFIFKDYQFSEESKELNLTYSYDNTLVLKETFKFDFEYASHDKKALDRAMQLLFFVAGVSYYKMYQASQITVEKGQISKELSEYLNKTYLKGLGEFFYVNNLDPNFSINFPVNGSLGEVLEVSNNSGKMVGIGGGKDSLVSVELLRQQEDVSTWSLNHRDQLEPLVNTIGLKHFWVDRKLDPQILELNAQDALNGHIPISAILSAVGLAVCILTGNRDSVVSNESSASEPSLNYRGVDINHQYSKSIEYERSFQSVIKNYFGDSLMYYSLLRPLSELRIAEIFAKAYFDKYAGVFSSCNRAFRHGEHHLFWCGECPKCAFVFMALTPFMDKEKLVKLWGGKNLLLDPSLEPTYRQLLGISGNKPLDCVGEVKESRAAMKFCQKIYPELNKYVFEIPEDYDFRAWSEHAMPEEIFNFLKRRLNA